MKIQESDKLTNEQKIIATKLGLLKLAETLGNVTTTRIYTQKPLGALQCAIEKVQFF